MKGMIVLRYFWFKDFDFRFIDKILLYLEDERGKIRVEELSVGMVFFIDSGVKFCCI